MMYGKSGFNPLSRFVKDEIPEKLIEHEMSRREAMGGKTPFGFGSSASKSNPFKYADPFGEGAVKRSAPFGTASQNAPFGAAPKTPFEPSKPKGAESYGVEKFSPNTRVSHMTFGDGTVVSARDMGGDVLYEVKFDSGVTKKLMATFAKLKRI
jgi:DNA helicase-2/ATP-dependent DNA helicase PcrA